MLFQEVLEKWLDEKKNYIKLSTVAYYRYEAQRYIIPVLGMIEISDLTENVIQNAVIQWQTKGMNGEPLSKGTVQNIVMIVKQVLKYAAKKNIAKNQIIEINYLHQYHPPKRKVFSIEEQNALIQAALKENSYKSFGILLCINSGLRIGEICALKWEDIDIEQQMMHIAKTLQRVYSKDSTPRTKIVIDTPKTYSSIRDVPISDKICCLINSFPDIRNECYVLTNSEDYLEPRVFRKYFSDFLKHSGIKALNFHSLRHTFATRCIENGAEYKSVSEILGHSTINTTLNMYVHPQMQEKRKCVDLISW